MTGFEPIIYIFSAIATEAIKDVFKHVGKNGHEMIESLREPIIELRINEADSLEEIQQKFEAKPEIKSSVEEKISENKQGFEQLLKILENNLQLTINKFYNENNEKVINIGTNYGEIKLVDNQDSQNVESSTEETNATESKTTHTQIEKKEIWQRLPKFVKHYLAINEIIEVKDPKLYGEFSESTIRDLTMKGQIQIEDPREFQLFFYNKYGEMLRFSRLPRRLHFIKKMQYEAEKEHDPEIKRLRLSLVCALYEELNRVYEDEGRSRENQLKVNELMDESHKYYNDYVDRISSENYKQQKIDEIENIKSTLKLIIQSKKVDFDNKIIQIPGTSASWLLDGYLWYESGCSLDSRHFVGKRGDWVEFGDIVFKEYGIEFYNPVCGFLLPWRFTNSLDNLWEIIPPKNYELPEDIGEFIFGDLIDVMYKKFKNGTMYDKYPIEHLEKTVEELKNCQLVVRDLDGELKSLFDSI